MSPLLAGLRAVRMGLRVTRLARARRVSWQASDRRIFAEYSTAQPLAEDRSDEYFETPLDDPSRTSRSPGRIHARAAHYTRNSTTLFQVNSEDVDGAAQTKCCDGNRREDGPEETRSRGISVN